LSNLVREVVCSQNIARKANKQRTENTRSEKSKGGDKSGAPARRLPLTDGGGAAVTVDGDVFQTVVTRKAKIEKGLFFK
jgi:hypothetical protein